MRDDVKAIQQAAVEMLHELRFCPKDKLAPFEGYMKMLEFRDEFGRVRADRPPFSVQFCLGGTRYALRKDSTRWRKLVV